MPRPKKEAPNRADGLYEVKITLGKAFDGKLIRKSFYSTVSKADARKLGNEYRIEMEAAARAGDEMLAKEVSFRSWSLTWLQTYKRGKVKDNTCYGTYQIPVELHLIPYFKDAALDSVRPVDIQRFFNAKAETSSLESIKKMRACLRAIFATAVENDLCRKNPVTSNLTISSTVQATAKRVYTAGQYKTAHDFAQTHKNGLAILLLLETGISRSELLGLRWDDLDTDEGILYIRQGLVQQKDSKTGKIITVTDGLKNDHRCRMIPLHTELVEKISSQSRVAYIGGNAAKGTAPTPVITTHIFHAPEGGPYTPMNWTNRVFKPFMEDLHSAHPDVPALNPHELRHTRATLWKDDGVDLFSIAKLLGHSDLDMLAKRYAHNNIDTLRRAIGIERSETEDK